MSEEFGAESKPTLENLKIALKQRNSANCQCDNPNVQSWKVNGKCHVCNEIKKIQAMIDDYDAEDFGADELPAHLAKWKMDYQFTARNGERFDIYNLGDECLRCGFYEYYYRNGVWYCADCRAKKSGQRNAEEFGAEDVIDMEKTLAASQALAEAITDVFIKHNIRNEKQQWQLVAMRADDMEAELYGVFGAESFEATAYCKECNKEHDWELGYGEYVCGLKCNDSECGGWHDNPEHEGYHINAKHGASTFPACYFGAKCEKCETNPVAIVAYDDEPYHDEYCSQCWNTNNMVIEGAKQYYQSYNVIPAFAHEIKYMNRIAKKVLNAESWGAESFGAETDYDDYIQRIFTFIDEKLGNEYFLSIEDEEEVARFKQAFNEEFNENAKAIEEANDWTWEEILGAEEFGATKGMDTYSQPFSELKIKPTKTKVGILLATVVAGGLWYSKKMKEE